jgi:multicomponent Na+:H+ antiporter subunit G
LSGLIWFRDLAGVLLLAGGLLFATLGVVGLYRMPDVFTRMHGGAKAVTLGASMLLMSLVLLAPPSLGMRAFATLIFILLITPVGTYVSARAAHRRRAPMTEHTICDELDAYRRADRDAEKEPYPVD